MKQLAFIALIALMSLIVSPVVASESAYGGVLQNYTNTSGGG